MLGLYIRDEATKLRYRVIDVRRVKGEFKTTCGKHKVLVNERVVVLKCTHQIYKVKGFFRSIDGTKIPLKNMLWLDQLEYSYSYFLQQLQEGKLKKIEY